MVRRLLVVLVLAASAASLSAREDGWTPETMMQVRRVPSASFSTGAT